MLQKECQLGAGKLRGGAHPAGAWGLLDTARAHSAPSVWLSVLLPGLPRPRGQLPSHPATSPAQGHGHSGCSGESLLTPLESSEFSSCGIPKGNFLLGFGRKSQVRDQIYKGKPESIASIPPNSELGVSQDMGEVHQRKDSALEDAQIVGQTIVNLQENASKGIRGACPALWVGRRWRPGKPERWQMSGGLRCLCPYASNKRTLVILGDPLPPLSVSMELTVPATQQRDSIPLGIFYRGHCPHSNALIPSSHT